MLGAMPNGNGADRGFDLAELYRALDARRQEEGLSWAAATRAINARFGDVPGCRAIATSTVTALRTRPRAEGDGVLQMLLWLGRSPESFTRGLSDRPGTELPDVGSNRILRWDTRALYTALDRRRTEAGLSWPELASRIGGVDADALRRLSQGGRTSFPFVMDLVRWLDTPAASFTRASRG